MSFAVWKAFLYKSYCIFKARYIATAADILWPCILISLMIWISRLNGERPSDRPKTTTPQPQMYFQERNDLNQPAPLVGLEKKFNDSEAYFTEATFRNKFLTEDPLFNEHKISKRSAKELESPYEQSRSDIMREVCSMNLTFAMILLFMGVWSGAGTLAHAERMSGSVERMRMYGISDLSIVASYMLHAAIKQVITVLLSTILLKGSFGGDPLMKDLDFGTIFFGILFTGLHCTTYFLAVASFFSSPILRNIVGTSSFMYLIIWAIRQHFSVPAQVFGYMFPPFSLGLVLNTACGLEELGGITAKSLVSSIDGVNSLPILVIFLLMLIGSFIMLLIFYYMLNIKPGPYGSAQPIHFILPRCIQEKLSLKIPKSFLGTNEEETFREGLYEKADGNINVGIRIENLYKKYGNVTSVKNLSLDIYSGQITALLGHNGAGKTTTLSILAGMLSPTSGSAYYEGYNIFSNLKRFRKNLGLCPQSNLLHPNLKVIDQMVFFGMLSGLTRAEAYKSAIDLLKTVGIYDKRNATIKQLSGGMQRKLCIALSLLGKPKVVILDEPTSGVDPESRREIWNVLLESRSDRIMLITTHFMEEADALGDQIAIMNHGELVCYGSSMFLKKHYGAGYHITVSTSPENFDRIIHMITSKIPDSSVIGEHQEWIKIKLPFQQSSLFPELFENLEQDSDISRIGLSCTTMEDVYLKVEEEAGGEVSNIPMTSHSKASWSDQRGDVMGYIHRFLSLLMKNFLSCKSRWIITLLLFIIVPPIASYVALNDFNTDFNTFNPNSSSHDVTEPTPTQASFGKKENSYKHGGKSLNEIKAPLAPEDYDSILEAFMDSCHPDPFLEARVMIFTIWMSMVLFIISCTFATFVHNERVSSVKHLMLMTGLSPATYWISVILWDMILMLVFTLLSWITLKIADSDKLFERDGGSTVIFLIILLAGWSMVSSVYFCSTLFKTMRGVIRFYFAGVFTLGFISNFLVPIKSLKPYSQILKLQPFTSTMLAVTNFMTLAAKKQDCAKCSYAPSCKEILTKPYLEDDDLRNDLIFLAADMFFYLFLVIINDYGLFSFLWDMIYSNFIGRVDNTALEDVDGDVATEKGRVNAAINMPDGNKEPLTIVDGLAKKYSKSMVAVYDVTFAVAKGECFGLLGVNGAGKSTTFNMLTGMIYPTEGNVFLKGYSLRRNKAKYLSQIGYCPQHNALINRLTGRQLLTLFAKLRLVPSQEVGKEVQKWTTLFGLDEYCDRPCGTYSGGNKRKLNTALAFIGDPNVILLDEPTTGVDPFIRRNLWSVIHACNNTDQAIIISSHSMDECEAVCDRLTIMAKGRMECIGNTQHLKALYGKGYVIMITLKVHDEAEVTSLKKRMQWSFSSECVLKDEHQVLLHYHLGTHRYKLSQLFKTMESIKKEFRMVDDYIITDSSLEEVFLSFGAKRN